MYVNLYNINIKHPVKSFGIMGTQGSFTRMAAVQVAFYF